MISGGKKPDMNLDALTPRLKHQLAILSDAGFEIPNGARILDLGCGEGDSVRALREAGYDAWGCDIDLWETAAARELIETGFVKAISMQPYRLPFADGEFDVVLSFEVLEHVQNYPELIEENYRVSKPGTPSLHLFPGRWTPIELHTYVPLASVHRSYPWLLLWAVLGIRNEYQKGLGSREVAGLNWQYLRTQTTYLATAEVRRLFASRFTDVQFREDLFLKHSISPRGQALYKMVRWFPFLLPIYATCWNRVLVATR
jgi:SAM-dependent methyltransferase